MSSVGGRSGGNTVLGFARRLCVLRPAQFVVRDDSRVVMHRVDFPDSVLLDVVVLEDAFLPLGSSSFYAGYRQLDPAGPCGSVRPEQCEPP